jgi:hypothetical protein
MRIADYVTLNFNNKISIAAVFLDTKKTFDSTWQPALLYKLSKLTFSTSLIKIISRGTSRIGTVELQHS